MSYGQLCPSLDEHGFALHNLASLPHISIAGACATGTHGSGVKNGNLATAVSALEIVTAERRLVLTLSRDEGPAHVSRPRSSIWARSAWSPRSRWTCSRPSRCGRTCTWICRWRRSGITSKTSSRPATASACSPTGRRDASTRSGSSGASSRARRSTAAPEFYGATPATSERAPDRRALGGELHGADGRAGAVVRAAAALPHGVHAEQRQGAAVRVFRPAQQRGRGHPRRRAAARSGEPASDDHGAAHDRRATTCG